MPKFGHQGDALKQLFKSHFRQYKLHCRRGKYIPRKLLIDGDPGWSDSGGKRQLSFDYSYV